MFLYIFFVASMGRYTRIGDGLGRIHEHTSDALLSSFCILALLYALELLGWGHSVLLFHSHTLLGRRHFGRMLPGLLICERAGGRK